jgi:hypothetical protein
VVSSVDRAVVWVDRWQMACCGTPFSVGDSIDWTVSSKVDRSFLGRVTSPEVAEGIDYAEEHHGDDEMAVGLAGVVRLIRLASCRYELEEGGGSGPAAGSGQLREIASTTERPSATEDEDRPGWIVEVDSFRVH